ncbi:MAG: glycine--tRNA ligase subunit beta [Brevinema sp.]
MSHFLFEILLEEVPHSLLPKTTDHIRIKLPELLHKYGLTYHHINHFATPRRLAFLIEGLPLKSEDRHIEQKGPSLKAAYDDQGHPTKALTGFLTSYDVTLQDLEEREIKNQRYIFIQKTKSGLPLSDILPSLLKELIDSIQFTQPMRWNQGTEVFEFIRPVRGLVALIDRDVLPLSLFGCSSDRLIKGHRQFFPLPVSLQHASDYEETLISVGCIADFDKRKQSIQSQISQITTSLNAKTLLDDDLLTTLTSLTEYPHLIIADFDETFLSLPKEVLISEMKIHQKYIPLADQDGNLLPHYIITANIPVSDGLTRKNILAGNDRVLTARFTDGRFFFDEDLTKGLSFYADSLKSISFVDGAGSLADKINRMQIIGEYFRKTLAPSISSESLKTTIAYSKADLASLMVGEFPELQGIIGSYYAQHMGCDESICLAIKEHYYPMLIEGEHVAPTQELSGLLGLVDRLDNLLTLYAVGKTVTGSKDPYALRRQTIALISLVTQFGWDQFSLNNIFDDLLFLYQPILKINSADWKKMLIDFISVRLEGVLKSSHIETDTINAVLATNIDYILNDIKRVEALQKIRTKEKERFDKLIELAKRIHNIIKEQPQYTLAPNLLVEPAEQELYQKYLQIIETCTSLPPEQGLLKLVELETSITLFFDHIMVKTGDEKEQNRTALLTKISLLLKTYADFSKLS